MTDDDDERALVGVPSEDGGVSPQEVSIARE